MVKFNPTESLNDLSGKIIIVTGANTGIGYSTVKHLANRGAKVYLGSRTEQKGKEAVEKLKGAGIAKGDVVFLPCDLGSPASAKKAAEDFLQLENRLDVLVNNAACTYDKTETPAQDGISEMMMVNHIATFQFTTTLLPLLKKTSEEKGSDVRIVTLSSDLHRKTLGAKSKTLFNSMDEFKNFYTEATIPTLSRYNSSKFANLLFSNGLQRRLSAESSNIICISLHPGVVNTSVSGRMGFPLNHITGFLMSAFALTPDKGAYNSCFAAASPLVRKSADKYKSAYLMPVGRIVEPAANAKDVGMQDALWETTEKYLKQCASK